MNRYAGLKFKYRGCTSGIKRRREKRERERITLKFWFMAVVAEKQKWKGDRRNSWWYLSNTFHLFRNTLILWSIQSRVRKRIQEEYIYIFYFLRVFYYSKGFLFLLINRWTKRNKKRTKVIDVRCAVCCSCTCSIPQFSWLLYFFGCIGFEIQTPFLSEIRGNYIRW